MNATKNREYAIHIALKSLIASTKCVHREANLLSRDDRLVIGDTLCRLLQLTDRFTASERLRLKAQAMSALRGSI